MTEQDTINQRNNQSPASEKVETQEDVLPLGPIVSWEQDQWWLEGKSRRKIHPDKSANTKKLLLVVGVVLIVLIVLLELLMGDQVDREVPSENEGVPEETIESTSFQEQIKSLRSQLSNADPAIKESPFPQLEMSVIIEE